MAAFVGLGVLLGCDDGGDRFVNGTSYSTASRNFFVEQRLQSELASSTNSNTLIWREYLAKWPIVRQRRGFAWNEQLDEFHGNVAAETLIEGRCSFKLILGFEIDAELEEVSFPELRCHVAEVKQVIVPRGGATGGGASVSYRPNQYWFDAAEWRKLVEARWYFSIIGIDIISNAPIQNIESILNMP